MERKEGSGGVVKFSKEMKKWLINLVSSHPVILLDEAKALFQKKFQVYISKTSVFEIIRSSGLTRKSIQQRAVQVCLNDVLRFINEMNSINWTYSNLVFLDEVGFDSRDVIRKHGHAMKGERMFIRGKFGRTPRVSLLCFIGVTGLLDAFETPGTFTRSIFIDCCTQFILNKHRDNVRQFPGKHSVFILDGARIHIHPDIPPYLRSFGIIPIYLPGYCPFFNPIEMFFGDVKKYFTKYFRGSSGVKEMNYFIATVLQKFGNRNMKEIFKKCGYVAPGVFSPEAMNISLSELGYSEMITDIDNFEIE